jgi:regulation of enolase protein 1 (concanavalin A-like superfamily)
MTGRTIRLAELPFALSSEGPVAAAAPTVDGDKVRVFAGPGADLFLDPRSVQEPPDAERFVATVAGDGQFSASVRVDFRNVFDSGVLICYHDDGNWVKLCAELDPERRGRVVSVVTRDGRSDDANGWEIPDTVHLRVSRMGNAFALHASDDGLVWRMVRYCALNIDPAAPIKFGLLTQSPTGEGTTATFASVRFTATTLSDVRDGS